LESKGFFYFAHPYTCKDGNGNYVPAGEDANFSLCNHRAACLIEAGYNIYSPISHTHPIHRASPTFLKNHEHHLWYLLDMEFLNKTNFDGIVLAPGWETSQGCQMEKKWFEEKGLPVLYYKDLWIK